ncbi:MAG: TetM/TetW/TetO/TetS family tetracycline resistance ribosomal protection protein [Firmicutes bacterium]|nr:TetM/TetW/TetO/TetS family tetracycline resistance ribosomal protection protein [Bacillota bacterium]
MSGKKRITIGILAHVDAGKTTLSEAMLAVSGVIPKAGRVDNGDSFLDTDVQERKRGITIFSGQAQIQTEGTELILVDTPGHVDFSAEMERTLSILDAAVLVISGRQLVQGHTLTIWKLLQKHHIPVFIFVNKMDLEGTDPGMAMDGVKSALDDSCVRFDGGPDPEELAMCDERLLDRFLAGEELPRSEIITAISRRRIFPVWFGSALHQAGVRELLAGLDAYTRTPVYEDSFRAKVFRITRDDKGTRLTHMKITGGRISVRDLIRTSASEEEEKIHQIRIYSGQRFETAETAQAGQLVAVAGLQHTEAGQGLGTLLGFHEKAMLQPVLIYRLILPEGSNVPLVLQQLRQLQEEDPQLHIRWIEPLQEIQIRLMGEIQLEILRQLLWDRFGIEAAFDEGRIEYRETILEPVRGAGHFEPLRHYAEVHLRMEPLPQGSGLEFVSGCSSDDLDTNWQRLIMTHLTEREHPGVLTGAPITDMRITIEGGRAHLKHTEGGDFRQATCRAVRQGLRKAKCRLLEPWYEFTIELPGQQIGRAMADIQRMGGSFQTEETAGGEMIRIRGNAPVRQMRGYAAEVASYTKGYGHFSCSFSGFAPCQNEAEVIAASGYDPDRDIEHPADSVFCSHGAGRNVPWDEADEMMHVRVGAREEALPEHAPATAGGSLSAADDKELNRIFEKTYGSKSETRPRRPARVIEAAPRKVRPPKPVQPLPEILLVDGYNIIFAWEELRELSKISIDAARQALIEILQNYQGFRRCEVIAVFDAYKVKGGTEHTEKHGNVTVVFTAEAETADTYIERASYQMKRKFHVRVATSDRLEQMIILGNDAFRVSASELQAEVSQINDQIREILQAHQRQSQQENKNRIVLPLHTE